MSITAPLQRTPVRVAVILLLLLLLASRLSAGRMSDSSLKRVQDAGVLVVAFDASYPPFETTDGQGNFGGFDAEVGRAIAQRLGVQVRFANIAFDSLYDALPSRKADVVVSGLRYESERTRDVIYSAPYFDAGQALIVRAADAITKPADLAGRSVAVETASEGDVEARKLAAKTPGLKLQGYDSPQTALAALRRGDVAAAVTDAVTAMELTKDQTDLRLLLPPFAPDALVIAGNIEDRSLMREIDRILKQLRDDSTLARLQQQAF